MWSGNGAAFATRRRSCQRTMDHTAWVAERYIRSSGFDKILPGSRGSIGHWHIYPCRFGVPL